MNSIGPRNCIIARLQTNWGKANTPLNDIIQGKHEYHGEGLAFAVHLYIVSADGYYSQRIAEIKNFLARIKTERLINLSHFFYSLIGLLRAINFLTLEVGPLFIRNVNDDEDTRIEIELLETLDKYLRFPFPEDYKHEVEKEIKEILSANLKRMITEWPHIEDRFGIRYPNTRQTVFAGLLKSFKTTKERRPNPIIEDLYREIFYCVISGCPIHAMPSVMTALFPDE